MAGRPRRTAMIEQLEQRTRTFFEDDAAATHLDYAEAFIAGGGSIQQLAEELATTSKLPIERETLRRYLYSLEPDNAKDRLDNARREGSHAKQEQAQSIADNVVPLSDAVAKARLQVSTRQWTAERWNPDDFGKKTEGTLNVNITTLHLSALRNDNTGTAQTVPPRVLSAPHAHARLIDTEVTGGGQSSSHNTPVMVVEAPQA